MYWVSCIIQDNEKAEPWLCAASTGCWNFEEAKNMARKYAENHRCLSIWIDKSSDRGMEVCFHKCFINSIGTHSTKIDW